MPGDQLGHPAGIHPLAGLEGSARARLQRLDRLPQGAENEGTTDSLVVDAVAVQAVLVEEVAEGSVSGIVQETGDPDRLLDTGRGRRRRVEATEIAVGAPGPVAGEMHGAQSVPKARTLRLRKHPPGRLQLV